MMHGWFPFPNKPLEDVLIHEPDALVVEVDCLTGEVSPVGELVASDSVFWQQNLH